ncbi:hypothetical protein LCGC14_0297910 [marine sediment metagenome]|uniref:Uncharacterized protein n=1 Tax=marine sediment metagenome TaxID=412755 RepID=A0A0F9U868_9ZZZZ
MPEYDNEMKGVLFRNTQKTTDKHPDYKGQCTIGGRKLWVAGWINTSQQDGKKYMALKFSVPQEQAQQPAPQQQYPSQGIAPPPQQAAPPPAPPQQPSVGKNYPDDDIGF